MRRSLDQEFLDVPFFQRKQSKYLIAKYNNLTEYAWNRDFHFSKVNRQRVILWVKTRSHGLTFPYRISFKTKAKILKSFKRDPRGIQDDWLLGFLIAVGILYEPSKEKVYVNYRHGSAAISKGPVVGQGVVPAIFVNSLWQYYQKVKAGGVMVRDQIQVKNQRDYIHNDVVGRFTHKILLRWAKEQIGREVLPSYSFICAYRPGAVLSKHIDRDECEWNISLQLSPIRKEWPLFIKKRRKTYKISLSSGDMVLFSGTREEHWRRANPNVQDQYLALFHFVEK